MPPLAPIQVLRTSPQMFWLMVGILAAVNIFTVFVAITMEPSLWEPIPVLTIMLVVTVLWGKTTTLTLTHDSIHYRSLLKRVDIALAEVIKVEHAFGFIAFSYKPYQRIVITVRENAGEKEITLNAGLFDQREIKRWTVTCTSTLREYKQKNGGHPLADPSQ